MQNTNTQEQNGQGKQKYLAGTLNDWFNLSAELGRNDQEALALDACLHGLAQQAGRAFLIEKEDGVSLDWPEGLAPHTDLLAHALKFSGAISSPYTDALLELAGFTNVTDRESRKSWNWRSYTFTMETLAQMGGKRREQAFDIGRVYIDAGGTDERVVTKYVHLLHSDGQVEKAQAVAEDWLSSHLGVDAPQLISFLLDKFECTPQETIDLTSRAITGLAMDQPTAPIGNLVLQRAFAYDKRAHLCAKEGGSPRVCALIEKAIVDFETAGQLQLDPLQRDSMQQRRILLTALAKEHDCDIEIAEPSEPEGESKQAEPEDESKQVAMQLLRALENGVPGSDLLETVQRILDEADEATGLALRAVIKRISGDDDAPEELRRNATFIAENLIRA